MIDPLTGALIAGGISAGASALQGAFGRKGKWEQRAIRDPRQLQEQAWAGQQAQNIYQNPSQGFEPIRAAAMNHYNRNTIPSLGEQFIAGTNARTSSPTYNQKLNTAQSDLQERLGGLEAQYGLQRQQLGNQLLGYSQAPSFENIYNAGGPTGLSNLFGGIAQGAGALGNQQFGQWAGMSGLASQPNSQSQQQPPRGVQQDVQSLMAPPVQQQQPLGNVAGQLMNNVGYQAQYNNYGGGSATQQQANDYWNNNIPNAGQMAANYQVPGSRLQSPYQSGGAVLGGIYSGLSSLGSRLSPNGVQRNLLSQGLSI